MITSIVCRALYCIFAPWFIRSYHTYEISQLPHLIKAYGFIQTLFICIPLTFTSLTMKQLNGLTLTKNLSNYVTLRYCFTHDDETKHFKLQKQQFIMQYDWVNMFWFTCELATMLKVKCPSFMSTPHVGSLSLSYCFVVKML